MDWPLLRKADPEANTGKGGLARQLMFTSAFSDSDEAFKSSPE